MAMGNAGVHTVLVFDRATHGFNCKFMEMNEAPVN
jgi:hypothetical protein